MAFKPDVKNFREVTTKLRQISKYLNNVNKALKRLDWKKLPKKRKRNGGGGQDAGSKPPGGWPP